MNAIITVVGHDSKGIISKVSAKCAEAGANILEISQSILKEYFAMIMLVELDKLDVPFREFTEEMKQSGKEFGVDISVMHEDIFNTMHHI